MSIYGKPEWEFRPRPKSAVLLIVSTFAILLSAALTRLFLNAVDLGFAWSQGWKQVFVIYAPLAESPLSPFFASPPLDPRYIWAPVVLAAASAGAALLLVVLWPSSDRLGSRLFVHILAGILTTIGVLAISFEPMAFNRIGERSAIPRLGWNALAMVCGLALIVFIERRRLQLLGNVEPVERGLQRLRIWILQIPWGYAVLLLLALGNRWYAGASALALTLIASFGAAMMRPGPGSFERLSRVNLRGSLILTPPLALAVIVSMCFTFGLPAVSIPHRVITFGGPNGFHWEPNEALLRRQLRDPESLEKRKNEIRFRGRTIELENGERP